MLDILIFSRFSKFLSFRQFLQFAVALSLGEHKHNSTKVEAGDHLSASGTYFRVDQIFNQSISEVSKYNAYSTKQTYLVFTSSHDDV